MQVEIHFRFSHFARFWTASRAGLCFVPRAVIAWKNNGKVWLCTGSIVFIAKSPVCQCLYCVSTRKSRDNFIFSCCLLKHCLQKLQLSTLCLYWIKLIVLSFSPKGQVESFSSLITLKNGCRGRRRWCFSLTGKAHEFTYRVYSLYVVGFELSVFFRLFNFSFRTRGFDWTLNK